MLRLLSVIAGIAIAVTVVRAMPTVGDMPTQPAVPAGFAQAPVTLTTPVARTAPVVGRAAEQEQRATGPVALSRAPEVVTAEPTRTLQQTTVRPRNGSPDVQTTQVAARGIVAGRDMDTSQTLQATSRMVRTANARQGQALPTLHPRRLARLSQALPQRADRSRIATVAALSAPLEVGAARTKPTVRTAKRRKVVPRTRQAGSGATKKKKKANRQAKRKRTAARTRQRASRVRAEKERAARQRKAKAARRAAARKAASRPAKRVATKRKIAKRKVAKRNAKKKAARTPTRTKARQKQAAKKQSRKRRVAEKAKPRKKTAKKAANKKRSVARKSAPKKTKTRTSQRRKTNSGQKRKVRVRTRVIRPRTRKATKPSTSRGNNRAWVRRMYRAGDRG